MLLTVIVSYQDGSDPRVKTKALSYKELTYMQVYCFCLSPFLSPLEKFIWMSPFPFSLPYSYDLPYPYLS